MSLLSVILPVHNDALLLPDTLAALRNQTWTRWEAFIIDDGSSDDSHDIAMAAAALEPRITVIQTAGLGLAAACNVAALNHARGDVLSFCTAGHLWTPTKLTEVAHQILGRGTDACFGRVAMVSEDRCQPDRRTSVPSGPLNVPMLLADDPVVTLSNLSVVRGWIRRVGGFDQGLRHCIEVDLLIRMMAAGAGVQGIDRDHVHCRVDVDRARQEVEARRQSRRDVLRRAMTLGREGMRRSMAPPQHLGPRTLTFDPLHALMRGGARSSMT